MAQETGYPSLSYQTINLPREVPLQALAHPRFQTNRYTMRIVTFPSREKLRSWLQKNHGSTQEPIKLLDRRPPPVD